jgi:hypothetical protein
MNRDLILPLGTLAAVIVAVLLRGRGKPRRLSDEEQRLLNRAAEGDEKAAAELVHRAQVDETALRALAATDAGAALQYRLQKESQLKAVLRARESLAEKAAAAGYSAERTAEVRARIEAELASITRDIERARLLPGGASENRAS